MASESLASFIESVSGDSLAVEENLGGGFVRLRTAEAERRQAKHDIRSVEDIVVEMLRNARDAHAKNIYLAISREGNAKTLTFLDDGDGVPDRLQELVFEPRVTSKLDTMVMDKWGVHGRGMALYSIKCNTKSARIVTSGEGLGSSFAVVVDLDELDEKADQSTYPKLIREEDGSVTVGRGPHNVIRNTVEFALEHRDKVNVYLGSPTDILARLYLDGSKLLTDEQLLFCDDFNELPVCCRAAIASDASELVQIANTLNLPVSERTAHRILAGQIKPAPAPLNKVVPVKQEQEQPVDLYKDRRGLKIAKEDIQLFQSALEQAFEQIGERYYMQLSDSPKVKVGKDSITVRFNIDKDL